MLAHVLDLYLLLVEIVFRNPKIISFVVIVIHNDGCWLDLSAAIHVSCLLYYIVAAKHLDS